MDALFEMVDRLTFVEKFFYGLIAIPVVFFVLSVLMVACFWAVAWGVDFVASWPWPSITE